jgi:uncharacterized protein (DUF1810 family)
MKKNPEKMTNEALERFLKAQEINYHNAFAEIKTCNKRSHWMWYVFPQLKGLGFSAMAVRFAIQDLNEAKAYLAHPVLGRRLVEISKAVLECHGNNATDIMGSPDDLKLRSSMTLFSLVPGADPVFEAVLKKYYQGEKDKATLQLLNFQLK